MRRGNINKVSKLKCQWCSGHLYNFGEKSVYDRIHNEEFCFLKCVDCGEKHTIRKSIDEDDRVQAE